MSLHLLQGVTPFSNYKLTYFKEALFLEMSYINKKVIVSVIYRFSSQNNDDFDSFISNFQHLFSDINKRKPPLSVIIDDFNARSSSWWSNDINTPEGYTNVHK